MFKNIFSLKNSIGRKEYLICFSVLTACYFLNSNVKPPFEKVSLVLNLIFGLFFIFINTKRCRDLKLSPFVQLIPGSPLIFIFRRGVDSIKVPHNEENIAFRDSESIIIEKTKKNLVYVGIFSIIMLFAGFTSGYIVSMGDVFWVKYPLPLGFWLSTASIALSSILYILAIKSAKKRNLGQVKIFMIATLLTGIGFAVFQIKGYGELIDEGANFRNSIMVTDGRYGDYFEIKYKGQFIEVDANDYLIKGKVLSESQMNELKSYMKSFENTDKPSGYNIPSLSPNFVLYFKNEPLSLQNGKLIKPNGEVIQYLDMKRLKFLAWNIRDGRGDFFHKGKLGKDFHIFYKGKELSYKNRSLMFGNKILSAPLQNKINQSRDTSTSYLYLITVLHFLHIFGALIYLIKMVKISFSSSFDESNELSLRLGAIFWHFLGLLWLYLLLFFLFIH